MGAHTKPLPPTVKNRPSAHRYCYAALVNRTRRVFQQTTPSQGYNLNRIADRVCSVMAIEASEIWKTGKSRRRVAARSLVCYWAVRELGMSMTELSRRLNLSLSGVSQGQNAVRRSVYKIFISETPIDAFKF